MPQHKVYLLSNTQNDKTYVGYTGQKYVSSRWGKHRQEARRGTDTHLYRAIRLYGPEVFSWQILGEFDTREEAQNAEKLWILLLNSNHSDYGYNTTFGGEAPQHTEETKKKISQVQKDNPKSPEFYASLLASSKTPESRAKQAESLKRAWKEGKFAGRNGDNHWTRRLGRSQESRNKTSVSNKKAWEEGRNKGSTGLPVSAETRSKRSASVHKFWETKRNAA